MSNQKAVERISELRQQLAIDCGPHTFSVENGLDYAMRHGNVELAKRLESLRDKLTTTIEAEIKEKCGATLRCMPMNAARFAELERQGHRVALFARAY